jgi:NADH-quinone oxidoreductase subunit I
MPAGQWEAKPMANIDYTRTVKYFLLQDFWAAFKLGMKVFFPPKGDFELPT